MIEITFMPFRYLILTVFAAASALLFAATLVSALIHTKQLPACPSCLKKKMRPSKRASLIDRVVGAINLYPSRCEACLRRFYTFGRARRHAASSLQGWAR
jgi:hypothetical protein